MDKDFADFRVTGYSFWLHGIEYKEFTTSSVVDIYQTPHSINVCIDGKQFSSSSGIKIYDKQAKGEISIPLVDRNIKQPAARIHKCRLLFTRHTERYVISGEITIRLWMWPAKCHVYSSK